MIYIYKISSTSLIYYGMTRFNIYKRLYAHIKNWEAYHKRLSKKYCSSYKLFDEDMDSIKIEIMEKHENKTFEELTLMDIHDSATLCKIHIY